MSEAEAGEATAGENTPVAEKVNGTGDVPQTETDGTTQDSTTPDATPGAEKTPQAVAEAPPVTKPKYRHDWYQTESDICINILIKRVKKENVNVNFQENSVTVRIEVGDDDIYNLELALAHQINTNKCFIKVYGTKVELRMRKCEGLHWESLEPKQGAQKLKLPSEEPSTSSSAPGSTSSSAPASGDGVHKYPSSSHYTRNWDKLVADVKQEEKDEKPEGDAALNKLFQQIYRDGNDEVKKAMNKSFMESGGTVLSTNWGEIGKGKVERKPPDGMEWKEYEK